MSESHSKTGCLEIVLGSALGFFLAKGCSSEERDSINRFYGVNDRLTVIESKIDNYERQRPVLKAEDVIGGPALEHFYETNDGCRLYLMVDGKRVDEYFPRPEHE